MTEGLFSENIVLILSTCTLGMLGLNFYTTTNRSFKSNDKMQTKEVATLIFLASIYVLSKIGEWVDIWWKEVIGQMPDISTFGVLLIVSRIAVNNLVPNWKYDDQKSIFVYFIGAFLFLFGFSI